MSLKITGMFCTGCGACESECPNEAIHAKGDVFAIDASKCSECEGFYDKPQCVAACPADCIEPA
jgi:ferredoxin